MVGGPIGQLTISLDKGAILFEDYCGVTLISGENGDVRIVIEEAEGRDFGFGEVRLG